MAPSPSEPSKAERAHGSKADRRPSSPRKPADKMRRTDVEDELEPRRRARAAGEDSSMRSKRPGR